MLINTLEYEQLDDLKKIKKVNIEELQKIAETLDMSLQKLLEYVDYNELGDRIINKIYKKVAIEDIPEIYDLYCREEKIVSALQILMLVDSLCMINLNKKLKNK